MELTADKLELKVVNLELTAANLELAGMGIQRVVIKIHPAGDGDAHPRTNRLFKGKAPQDCDLYYNL